MQLKRMLSLVLAVVISMAFVPYFMLTARAAHGTAQPQTNGGGTVQKTILGEEETVTFIVEVEGDPLAMQAGVANLNNTDKAEKLIAGQQVVLSQINREIDAKAKKGFVYTAVFNGFSMEGTVEQMEKIKALDGVKNVYISSEIPIVIPVDGGGTKLMLDSAAEISNVDTAHVFGYSGEGTVIAVIDAGCDTSHEFFSTAPENPRYSKEKMDTLVKTLPLNAGTASSNQVYKNAKIPFAYNYTKNSADTYMASQPHGTHVAGIAAGKNGTTPGGETFSGVAPEAQLLIFSCSTTDNYLSMDAVLAALNDAVLLEADVINMSFGIDYADVLCNDAYRTVLDRCREAGVSVIAAAGNAGRGYREMAPKSENPDYGTAGLPGTESAATAVASFENSEKWYEYISLKAPDGAEYEAHLSVESDTLEAAYTGLGEGAFLSYVDCGYGHTGDFADVSGKLALIKRGENTFSEKVNNAKAAGAKGVLIYNYEEEVIQMNALGMPAVSLTLSEGTRLLERADKRLSYNGTGMKKTQASETNSMSTFSSWGVNATLELKPEISAPGGGIYSSVPDDKYDVMSGTSMASPYIAGVTALSRQYYKENPFLEEFNGKTGQEMTALIENLTMNSATVVRRENGVAYSPRVQGAGLVNMEGILQSRVLLTGDSGKAKLNLGDNLTDTIHLTFDITNISKETVTFDKITVEVLTDGYTESGGEYYVSDSVAVETETVTMPQSVTVLSGETVTFTAEVKPDSDFLSSNAEIFTNGFYLEGFVILKNQSDTALKASIPFMGFYGDWGSAPIFDSTIYDAEGSCLTDPQETEETGTFMDAVYSWGTVTLGRNPFFPEILHEKYIAYSTNASTALRLIMTNYRAMKNPVLSITNSDKTVVRMTGNMTLEKYTPMGFSVAADKFKTSTEGAHTLSLKAAVAGASGKTDELSIPFTLDNTYPEILSAVYDKGAKTITVTARENHFVAAFYVSYPVGASRQYAYVPVSDADYASDGSITKVIDASMIEDISEAEIGCADYALNLTYYDMNYFLDTVGAELISIAQLDTMTEATFNVKNNTKEAIEADFILAFYDDTHRLVALNLKNIEIGGDEEDALTFSLFENTKNASYVKLFVWDIGSLASIDAQKQFALQG